jgi:hypothetical protein
MNNLVDSTWRYPYVVGDLVLTQTERLQELLEKDFSRMNRR